MNGTLYLMPVTLGDNPPEEVIPNYVLNFVNRIDHYAVEDLRTARRYLKKAGLGKSLDDLHFYLLNEHSRPEEVSEILAVLNSGADLVLMSEAGVPAVADPGSDLVSLAHENRIRVVPLAGPSSIMLALMASGMNGQDFRFHGYLPVKRPQRINTVKKLENRVRESGSTQIFMETPYRNMGLFEDIVKTCRDDTRLCVAADITLPGEFIKTMYIRDWRKEAPAIHKRPSVFLIGTL